MAMEPMVSLLVIEQKPFCLSASPDKQKIISLRPRRLCGENVILDKHDFTSVPILFKRKAPPLTIAVKLYYFRRCGDDGYRTTFDTVFHIPFHVINHFLNISHFLFTIELQKYFYKNIIPCSS